VLFYNKYIAFQRTDEKEKGFFLRCSQSEKRYYTSRLNFALLCDFDLGKGCYKKSMYILL